MPIQRGSPVADGPDQPGRRELRQQVQPADEDDDERRGGPGAGRAEPQLGEVGQRVGARAAQRGGDQGEQQQVADRVADGEPQRVGPLDEHEPGDAEEARRRQVLPADRAGVPPRPDRAAGHVEVARGARDPGAVGRDEHGDEHDDGDRGQGGQVRHDGSPPARAGPRGRPLGDELAVVLLAALGAGHVAPADQPDDGVDAAREHPPRERDPEQGQRGDARAAARRAGAGRAAGRRRRGPRPPTSAAAPAAATGRRPTPRRGCGPGRRRARAAGRLRVTRTRWGRRRPGSVTPVLRPGPCRWPACLARPAVAGAADRGVDQALAHLAGVAAGHGQLPAQPARGHDEGVVAVVGAQLAHRADGDEQAAVGADEPGRRPPLLQLRQRRAQQVRAVGGVEADVVALRLGPQHRAALDEPGHAAELDAAGSRRPRRPRPGSGAPPPAGRAAVARRRAAASRAARTGLRT